MEASARRMRSGLGDPSHRTVTRFSAACIEPPVTRLKVETVALVTAALLLAVTACPQMVAAQVTPTSKCLAKKVKAIAKAEAAKIRCVAKEALTLDVPTTVECFQTADAKLSVNLAKLTDCSGSLAWCLPLSGSCRAAVDYGTLLIPGTPLRVPDKCVAAKRNAAANAAKGKLTCYSKATKKAIAVDAACLQKASDKFTVAFQKAGTCGFNDVTTVDNLIEMECVASVVGSPALVNPICGQPAGTCCDVAGACVGGLEAAACAAAGGTLHPDPAAVCGASGCTTDPSPATGGCCDFESSDDQCSVNSGTTAETCQGVAGVWYTDAVCRPDARCTGTFQCTPTGGLCPHHGACCAGDACIGGVCTAAACVESGCFQDCWDGTIRDTCTGLQWEKKVVTGGLHDVGNRYSWAGCCNADCTAGSYCQPNAAATATCMAQASGGTVGCSECASGTCVVDPFGEGAITTVWDWLNQVNAANFGGHADWRLPSEHGQNTGSQAPRELETIFEPVPCLPGMEPCIDSIFGPTAEDAYHTATNDAGSDWHVLTVDFNHSSGGVTFLNRAQDLYVRAVRPSP